MKRTIGAKALILMALVLAAVLFMTTGATAFAASGEPVQYVDAQGNTQTAQATPLTENMTDWLLGWYVVRGNVSIDGRIKVNGVVHLILEDGAKLEARSGIDTNGRRLTIYGQSQGTGTLTATGSQDIPGIDTRNGSTVTINGGTVTAAGGENAGGIGGGSRGTVGTVIINGGTVTARGGHSGAGIGGGWQGAGGTVTINGGTVTASSDYYGAGIGGGMSGNGGTVTINGGTVTATGGRDSAGIGGGISGAGGTVTVNGGTVTAIGNNAAGIGGGEEGAAGTVVIGNLFVYAGSSGDSLTDVSETFASNHNQRFVKIVSRDPISYLDWNDDQKRLELKDGREARTDYYDITTSATTLAAGTWYVVKGNVTVYDRMTVNGEAHLILTDGSTLTAQQGITVSTGTLHVYGQSQGTGRLTAIGGGSTFGIGPSYQGINGNITINGGTVTAIGGGSTFGIGPSYQGINGTVTINGGDVTATGGPGSVGISGPLTLGEGVFLYIDGSFVPKTDGDYARSREMRVNTTAPSSLTVTYDLNGFTGRAPTDTKSYKYKEQVTVKALTATPEDRCFKEWNTKPDGSGEAYVPGDSKTGSFAITGNTVLYAQWGPITFAYLDWDGAALTERIRDEDFLVSDSTTALSDGKWYVVAGNVTVKDRISVKGTVHLILCDGAKLTAKDGISLAQGNHLFIHGQSAGTGVLEATVDGWGRCAGIGGDADDTGGQLTVNGGVITARSTVYAAGIGGGGSGSGGTVTVNGGSVTAIGGIEAAGIGGGDEGAGGTVTVNGGSVTAIGGNSYGPGIGGSQKRAGGTLILNGGSVLARGGRPSTPAINSTVRLGPSMTVWAGEEPDPKTTGQIVDNFEQNHGQTYVYAASFAPITGSDLVLDGTLKLRFYVSLPEDFSDDSAAMDMSVHGRTITQKLIDAERIDGLYAFTCPVYAIEMAEPVSAVFRCSDGTAKKTVSVKQYLDVLEQKANKDQLGLSAADTAKLINMITAAKNYGHYMQPYLAGVHSFTVGEGKDYRAMPAGSDITPLTELPAFRRVWGPNRYDANTIASIHYYDSFGESTTLNIDLQLKGRLRSFSVTVDGEEWDLMPVGVNTYRVSIPDIAANNLGKAFHVELTVNGGIVYDAYLSALSYASAVLDTHRDNPDEAKALTAFYQYYEAAKAFE